MHTDPCQPRRTRRETQAIAVLRVKNKGLAKQVGVRVTSRIDSPYARAQYKGNHILLHPVNVFATASDLRSVVNHELTHHKDKRNKTNRARH